MIADLDYLEKNPINPGDEYWCACYACRYNYHTKNKPWEYRKQFLSETILELSLLYGAGQKYFGFGAPYELPRILAVFEESLRNGIAAEQRQQERLAEIAGVGQPDSPVPRPKPKVRT